LSAAVATMEGFFSELVEEYVVCCLPPPHPVDKTGAGWQRSTLSVVCPPPTHPADTNELGCPWTAEEYVVYCVLLVAYCWLFIFNLFPSLSVRQVVCLGLILKSLSGIGTMHSLQRGCLHTRQSACMARVNGSTLIWLGKQVSR
jgi:hypothetical protein